jgi:Ni/Co efflux regulator RcnB
MTKILTGIAALMIVAGAAALPVPAGAVEQGLTKEAQPTDLSSRHRGWRHHRYYGHRYWGPRRYYGHRYWGPRHRYGYYPYRYGYYGSPYYRRPGLAFGIGPFGFGVF